MHPLGLLWAGVTALVAGAAALRPSLFELARLGQEGPVEHLSHLVLLGAAAAWVACAAVVIREPGPRRVVAPTVVGYIALLLAEEIDWGAVYGLRFLSDGLHDAVGLHSLHQNRSSGSFFGDKQRWFAAPALLWFGLWRIPAQRVRAWAAALAPVAPTSGESRWFFVTLATYLLVDPFVRSDVLDPYQMLAYAVIGASGLRAALHLGRAAPEVRVG